MGGVCPALTWRGWEHGPGHFCLPVGPQPTFPCSSFVFQEHFLCIPAGSLVEREARRLLFIYMGITGDQKSALK